MLKRILILTLSFLFLTGCNGSKKNYEEIVFSSWGSITEVKVLKKIISDFELENPDIKVHFMHIPQNYFQKIHLLFASNTAPDVLFINNLYLPIYASNLLDLSNEFDRKTYYPQAIENLSYENKVLAIPRDISSLVLYVNTDIIKPPKNWEIETLLKISKKITTKVVIFCF